MSQRTSLQWSAVQLTQQRCLVRSPPLPPGNTHSESLQVEAQPWVTALLKPGAQQGGVSPRT